MLEMLGSQRLLDMRRIVLIVVLLVSALAGIGAAVWSFRASKQKPTEFFTAAIKRGDLVSTISATGTIEPEAAVDIGAQVAGVIVVFGTGTCRVQNKDGTRDRFHSLNPRCTVIEEVKVL
jgi:ammonia channel protein AmtB